MEIENKTKKYKTKKHLVYSCQYHVIFCTKYRRRVLTPQIQEELKNLILEKQQEYCYEIIELESMEDHIHLLIDIDPTVGVYTTVSKIKGFTSHELREKFPELRKRLPCLWTTSKFISTVGSVSLEIVKKYIESQNIKPKWKKTSK